ncbi:hypothetical protein KJ785_04870 [Patescibacteria group bacterium]|nr:hypothetical protein [Patescibacteria group bacterium]
MLAFHISILVLAALFLGMIIPGFVCYARAWDLQHGKGLEKYPGEVGKMKKVGDGLMAVAIIFLLILFFVVVIGAICGAL